MRRAENTFTLREPHEVVSVTANLTFVGKALLLLSHRW